MQFINEAPLYKIIRITGPHHHLLGLELSEVQTTMPTIVEALNADSLSETRLNFDDISVWVAKGVAAASTQFGKTYYVRKIQYIASDKPTASIYEALATEIIRRVSQLNQSGGKAHPTNA